MPRKTNTAKKQVKHNIPPFTALKKEIKERRAKKKGDSLVKLKEYISEIMRDEKWETQEPVNVPVRLSEFNDDWPSQESDAILNSFKEEIKELGWGITQPDANSMFIHEPGYERTLDAFTNTFYWRKVQENSEIKDSCPAPKEEQKEEQKSFEVSSSIPNELM